MGGVNVEARAKIRSFYSSDEFEPVLPDGVNFRHFRFKDEKGKWIKVKRRVRNLNDLKKNIKTLKGVDIYYTTSKWLNPDKLASKVEQDITKTILLGNDLVFDIDCDDPLCLENLEIAKKSTKNIYDTMKKFKKRFKFQYMSFTGSKGFRISYTDLNPVTHEDPKERITLVREDRKLFIDELTKYIDKLKKQGKLHNISTKIDREITENPFCVVRVLGTIHSKTGFITTKISPEDLNQPIVTLLNNIQYIYDERPGIPTIWEMTLDKDKDLSPRPRPRSEDQEDVSGLASSPYYYISNKVINTRCYVPLLIYQKNHKNLEKELLRLQQEHGLGNLYIMTTDKEIVVMSLKLFQKRHLEKMLNKTSSRTKNSYNKFKECYASLRLKPVKILEGKIKGQQSKGHSELIKKVFKLSHIAGDFTKEDKLKITEGVTDGEN